jgi:hypothetical protein
LEISGRSKKKKEEEKKRRSCSQRVFVGMAIAAPSSKIFNTPGRLWNETWVL